MRSADGERKEKLMKQNMKRSLSLLLALTMALTLLLPTAWAETGEMVTVNFEFDYRSIATDEMMAACGIDCPTAQTVAVPKGSTIYDALEKITDYTVSYNENQSMVTAFAEIGDIKTLCDSFWATYDPVFQYAGWMYSGNHVSGNGIKNEKLAENDTITFRYTVYYGTKLAEEWVNFDWEFVDAYYGIQEDIITAKALNENDYTAEQWTVLQTAITNAETVRQAVETADTSACLAGGLMLNYIAKKTTSLWGGPGSPTEQLQTARDKLERAIHKVVAPTGVTVPTDSIEIPMGTTYQLNAVVTPEGAPQGVIYEALTNLDCFTISESGLITPKKVASSCVLKVKSAEDPTKAAIFKFKITEAPAKPAIDRKRLMENIAASYTATYNDTKILIDMAAYAACNPDTHNKITDETKQNYINFVMTEAGKESPGEKTFALGTIGLQSIGVDPRVIYPVNSNTAVDFIEKLNSSKHSNSAWSAPYTLAAYNQGNYNTDAIEQAIIEEILKGQHESGCWNEFGESIQATANMITGLSFYYGTNAGAKAAIDKAVAYLSEQQKNDGTFDAYGSGSDADSCANVVMALAAVGINPHTDERFIKNSNSALDGLLSFALQGGNGFGYQDNITKNDYATEEGFRALIAAEQVLKTGKAYNIYDFSANQVAPGRATGTGEVEKPIEPDTERTITVSFALKSDTNYWVSPKSVTVKEGSTVYHVFTAALENTGITYEGAETGYVTSMTKDGKTLGEFTNGANSGWLYKVNGKLPDVGMTDYKVSGGDSVLWYYTTDWTADPDAGHYQPAEEQVTTTTTVNRDGTVTVTVKKGKETLDTVRGGVQVKLPNRDGLGDVVVLVDEKGRETVVTKSLVDGKTAYALLPGTCTVKIVDNGKDFLDVHESAWYAGAVDFVSGHDLYNGTGAGLFSPDTVMSRAMLAAVLYRLESTPEAAEHLLDAYADGTAVAAWAREGMSWAVEEKILQGTDGGRLAADAPITREQLAVMVYRYARACGMDIKVSAAADLSAQGVSSWAETAMAWAVDKGILEGKDGGRLAPRDPASRAEVAAILQRLVAEMVC